MHHNTTILTAVAIAVLLAACSKATDTVIPINQSEWDTKLSPVVQKLNEEDKKLLGGYLARRTIAAGLGGLFGQTSEAAGIPPGTTIGQAIAEQRTWMAEQAKQQIQAEAVKKEALAKNAAVRQQIADAVTVSLMKIRQEPAAPSLGRYLPYQGIELAIKNTGAKVIDGVAGRMVFLDVFGKEVGSMNFRATETIQPGSLHTWEGGRDYNQFMDEHRAIANLQEGKYSTRFEPEAVIFSDGTSLKTQD